MSKLQFPILGTTVAPMLGRESVMRRLLNDLTKRSPSHLSVVGPRFSGKSVVLHALRRKLSEVESPYSAVILWDLGHQTPETDGAFISTLCQRLGEGIREVEANYSKHLLSLNQSNYAELREVIELLADDEIKILMLWDGFDKPLATGKLTRNLWDQLRELASYPSLRIVTATRKKLQELIRSEESVSSDFWNIFDMVPVLIRPFDDADREIVYEESGIPFLKPARAELENWTGGFPPLFLTVVNELLAAPPNSGVGADNKHINEAALRALESVGAILSSLWDDCPPGARDLYSVLLEQRSLPLDKTGWMERNALIEMGLATVSGNKICVSGRLFEEYLKEARPDTGSMALLFATWDDYTSNIRSLLERRLAQVSRFDDRLYQYVELSIKNLPNDAEMSLNSLTSIEERALQIIWQRELDADRKIPPETIAYWTTSPRSGNRIIEEMMRQDSWNIPSDRSRQIGILQLLTGSRQDFEPLARFTSKDTYVLINAIHSYRNRNQHGDGRDIHLGVAIAALMTCIELLACLDRELGS